MSVLLPLELPLLLATRLRREAMAELGAPPPKPAMALADVPPSTPLEPEKPPIPEGVLRLD